MAWTECVSINKILSLPDSTECNILHVTNSKKNLKVIRFVKVSILGRNYFVCKCKLPKFTCHNTYVYFSCLICKYPLRFFFCFFLFLAFYYLELVKLLRFFVSSSLSLQALAYFLDISIYVDFMQCPFHRITSFLISVCTIT